MLRLGTGSRRGEGGGTSTPALMRGRGGGGGGTSPVGGGAGGGNVKAQAADARLRRTILCVPYHGGSLRVRVWYVVKKDWVLIQKSWGWFSSHEGVRKALNKTCQHGTQRHASIAGREVSETAVYPRQLCEAFAKALVQEREECWQRCLAVTGTGAEPPMIEGACRRKSGGELRRTV